MNSVKTRTPKGRKHITRAGIQSEECKDNCCLRNIYKRLELFMFSHVVAYPKCQLILNYNLS